MVSGKVSSSIVQPLLLKISGNVQGEKRNSSHGGIHTDWAERMNWEMHGAVKWSFSIGSRTSGRDW